MSALKFASILSLAIWALAYPCRGSFSPDVSERTPISRDGNSIVETGDGSGRTIRHNVWGTRYIDELVQTSIIRISFVTLYEHHWALQDANYNVLGIVDGDGVINERYQYTPYGKRTVFFSPGADDVGGYAATTTSRRDVMVSGTALCEIGHQGLMHDEESGLVYNRARMRCAQLGQFMQRDPQGQADGSNCNLVEHAAPNQRLDPLGENDLGQDIHDTPPINILEPPKLGDYGDTTWEVGWLPPPNVNDGWIIQHINRITSVFNCDNTANDVHSGGDYEYWEGWQVVGGVVYPGEKSDPISQAARDTFGIPKYPSGTKGCVVIDGHVSFIPGYKLQQPPWGHKVPAAGILPAIRNLPGWSDSEGSQHYIKVCWDNCCKPYQKTSVVKTVPSIPF